MAQGEKDAGRPSCKSKEVSVKVNCLGSGCRLAENVRDTFAFARLGENDPTTFRTGLVNPVLVGHMNAWGVYASASGRIKPNTNARMQAARRFLGTLFRFRICKV